VAKDTITITDNRTGQTFELPVSYGTYPDYGATVPAMDLRAIKGDDDDFGLLTYDPGLGNTCNVKSAITFIDGERGILRYRGYPIEEVAENASYLETANLLMFGELPTPVELDSWHDEIMPHQKVHEYIKKLLDGFLYDAHSMGVFVGTFGAMSTVFPDAVNVLDEETRVLYAKRILAMAPTIAAWTYRHSVGLPYVYPDEGLDYVSNFLRMLFRGANHGRGFYTNKTVVRALEVLFILHADHEQNCSTTAMRTVGSSQASPFVAIASAAAALHGQLHGGANQAALAMLERIGSVENIPAFIDRVKNREERLMGFGHRVYKNYDPRATIIKKMADNVLAEMEPDPLLDIAKELERIALEDEYFIERKLYPNVDFYSGIIYKAMGFPEDMFTVLFAIGRISGWLAHWLEMFKDPDNRIVRPRQQYIGADKRPWVNIEKR
jgi:citrate synthase